MRLFLSKKAFCLFMSIMLVLLCLTLCACGGEQSSRTPTLGEPSQWVDVVPDPGLTMEVQYTQEGTVTAIFRNTSDETFWFGQAFGLELDQNGEWFTLNPAPSEKNYAWTAEAIAIPPQSTIIHSHDLSIYGDRLEGGTYRICKEISREDGTGMSTAGYYSGSFTVTG